MPTTKPKPPPPPEYDPLRDVFPNQDPSGAILLSDEIQFYRDNLTPPLIGRFEPDNLKPARYNLRLGSEAHVEGEPRTIDEKNPLVLHPHEVAVVQTFEDINLPRFLAARWHLRVDIVYEGLLWVGALQVDPGWQGHLPCPIYNLANRVIILPFKEKVFSIDFVRTTPFRDTKTPEYPYESKRYETKAPLTVRDHDRHRLTSAVSETETRVRGLETRLNVFTLFGATAMAILFAALGVIATKGFNVTQDSAVPLSSISLTASLFALLIGSFALSRQSYSARYRSPTYVWTLIVILTFASLVWGLWVLIVPLFESPLKDHNPQWMNNLPAIYGVFHVVIAIGLSWIARWHLKGVRLR